jgi:hypothetical protein
MSDAELYDSARAWWVMNQARASQYRYAAVVFANVVRGAWEIDPESWRSSRTGFMEFVSIRWSFAGEPVVGDAEEAFVGRRIPLSRPDGKKVFGRGSVIAYWPGADSSTR